METFFYGVALENMLADIDFELSYLNHVFVSFIFQPLG
jgi:hypothetical protein